MFAADAGRSLAEQAGVVWPQVTPDLVRPLVDWLQRTGDRQAP